MLGSAHDANSERLPTAIQIWLNVAQGDQHSLSELDKRVRLAATGFKFQPRPRLRTQAQEDRQGSETANTSQGDVGLRFGVRDCMQA